MTKETGGSAFPLFDGSAHYGGMTLRDWFAGQIMCGMYANGFYTEGGSRIDGDEYRAIGAYDQADAMLKARSK